MSAPLASALVAMLWSSLAIHNLYNRESSCKTGNCVSQSTTESATILPSPVERPANVSRNIQDHAHLLAVELLESVEDYFLVGIGQERPRNLPLSHAPRDVRSPGRAASTSTCPSALAILAELHLPYHHAGRERAEGIEGGSSKGEIGSNLKRGRHVSILDNNEFKYKLLQAARKIA